MKSSKIIFLNGVTSSGKTTISKAIQEIANEQFYYLSNDMFFPVEIQMLHEKYIKEEKNKAQWKYMSEAIVLMYRFAKEVADLGKNIIIDGMFEEREAFVEYYNKMNYEIFCDIFKEYNVFTVEVFCPLDECRRRNIKRGDRGENQSQEQHEIMNKNIFYVFRVDTSIDNANECAEKILKELYCT